MSKIAAALLALVGLTLLSIPAAAQILPRGNVYGGVSYGQFTDVVNKQSYRGFEGSAEDLPFARLPHLGFVLDGSGYYRSGVTEYDAFSARAFRRPMASGARSCMLWAAFNA